MPNLTPPLTVEPPILIHGGYTPLRLAILGLALWTAILVLGPLDLDFSNLDTEAFAYLLISLGAILFGMWVGNAFGPAPARLNPLDPMDAPVLLFRVAALLAMIGLAMRVTDRVFLRGMQVSLDIVENRSSIEGDTTLYGLIGSLLFPIGLAMVPILWSLPRREQTPTKTVIAYVLMAYPALEALLQASRSSILQIMAMWLFYSFLFGRNRFVTRRPLVMLLGILATLALFQWIFSLRTQEELDVSFLVASQTSGYALYTPPSDWAISVIASSEGVFRTIVAAWLHFTQYLCHSFFVYFDNFVGFTGEHSYGMDNFYILVKGWYSLLGLGEVPNFYDRAGGQVGLAGTYFTHLYYDFGWFGPFFAFLVGFLMSKVYRLAVVRPWQWAPLYALLSFTGMLLMLDNMMTGGVAAFATVSLALYAAVAGVVAAISRHDSFRAAHHLIVTGGG